MFYTAAELSLKQHPHVFKHFLKVVCMSFVSVGQSRKVCAAGRKHQNIDYDSYGKHENKTA